MMSNWIETQVGQEPSEKALQDVRKRIEQWLLQEKQSNNDYDHFGAIMISHVECYKYSPRKAYTSSLFFIIITCGFILLAAIWVTSVQLFLFYTKVEEDFEQATHLMVQGSKGDQSIVPINRQK